MSSTPIARVVMYDMGVDRGPGTVKAVITDASHLAVSAYYNSPGEFYMTLPITHGQIGVCEPWLTHYAVEEWVDGAYVEKFAGILTDFDATDNEVVIYGMDYLGLLDRVIDSRYVQGSPEEPPPDGSKHVNSTISGVINNLLNYARNKTNSPVAFIDMGRRATFGERLTIYSTFVSIGQFISGLVESHRQGSGKRSRFWVEKYSGGYRFRLADRPGSDLTKMRMEYGGLVNGFQVIGFGNFAVKAHGIGRTQTGGELFYKAANAPGLPADTWGALETVQFYDNVADGNDLKRRVRQAAASASKVGKRLALALSVDALGPFDGYDIADNVPVSIQRGIIDTTRYGSGLWSIHGVEWFVEPDGSTELTLVLLPKEDGQAPNPDLFVDQEVLPAPIDTSRIAVGAITTTLLADDAVTNPKIADTAVASEHFDPTATAPLAELAYEADEATHAVAADTALQADTADLAVEVENVPATVVIDAAGITIENGALTLKDQFGENVLDGAGFGTTWFDFITYGVYNATFVGGTTNPITAATIVSGADSVADYAASLSDDIPYWVVESTNGVSDPNVLKRSTHSGTFQHPVVLQSQRCQWRIFQDVPVVPGQDYAFILGWSWTNGVFSKTITRTVGLQWRDDTHGAIGSLLEQSLLFSDDASAEAEVVATTQSMGVSPAPENARYLRVVLEFTPQVGVNGTADVFINVIRLEAMRQDRLRLGSTTDAALASTGHALQIGPTSGLNLIADANEIMARDNGSASELRLNNDGGATITGGALEVHGVLAVDNGITAGVTGGQPPILLSNNGFIEIQGERSTDPAAPAANSARIYLDDNGSGKTRLRVRFSSGAIQTIATQP